MFQICFRCENKLIYTGSFCHLYDSVKKIKLGQAGLFLNFNCPRKKTSFFLRWLIHIMLSFNVRGQFIFCTFETYLLGSHSGHFNHISFGFIVLYLMLLFVSHEKYILKFCTSLDFFCLFSCPYCVGVGKRDVACYVYRTTIKITLE